ncbi:MAG: GNAT family N-acetyltransferase [Pseudomonadota bacterium]|nr:GNAT family N-acetyltransferase [Pseudomonadota bacterium]
MSPLQGGVVLRSATADDLPYLRQLYAGTREQELAAVPWPPAAKQAFVDQQFALQHQHYIRTYVGAEFLVVLCGGTPVGRYYLWHSEADFLIIDISLDPGMRGRGVGSALIGQTQSMAAERGCGVRLNVRRDNEAARRLYLRLGFLPGTCEEDDAYLPMRWIPLS